jgi:hypothetical protein
MKLTPRERILQAREQLGLESTPLFVERLGKLSLKQAETEAKRLENKLLNARSTWGRDSRKALARLFDVRERMGEPVGPQERKALFTMPKAIVVEQLRVEERRLREHLDSHGVPVAAWRISRGMVSAEAVEANGVMPERQGADA